MLRSQSGLEHSALNDLEAKMDINSTWETTGDNIKKFSQRGPRLL
jgi:hypothetical protein